MTRFLKGPSPSNRDNDPSLEEYYIPLAVYRIRMLICHWCGVEYRAGYARGLATVPCPNCDKQTPTTFSFN